MIESGLGRKTNIMDQPQCNDVGVSRPRIILCGLRGGSGKTVVVSGLIGALRRRGMTISPFKKGPDYIDPQWISLAADRRCRNLDSFFMNTDQMIHSLILHGQDTDLSVIEGNRGLYDGMDDEGTYSTAELAMQLDSPVILIVDCTKATRTIAALVLGCKMMNPDVAIRGVILNQIACSRQESVIRAAIEKVTGIPVVGSISRLRDFAFPERHLGLNPPSEHDSPNEVMERLAEAVERGVDIEAIQYIAQSAPPLSLSSIGEDENDLKSEESVRIGVIRDEAFHFYYPENLEALQKQGAEIVEINALWDPVLPEIDGLYIGGGFPEMMAESLTDNITFRHCLRREIEAGLPVIAECGGLIYLSESMLIGERSYPMVGVFPVSYTVSSKPQGHGYTVVTVERENPFFPLGTEMRGHEFRYSVVKDNRHDPDGFAFRMQRGFGFDGEQDGLMEKNCLASFCHHHAIGNPQWAKGIMQQARLHKRKMAEQSLV